MSQLSAWRPRASSSGYYWSCSQRAAFDRGISEGTIDESVKDDKGPKAYAALGTLIHFRMQDGMRAKFPGPSKDFAPTEEEYASALTLFSSHQALDSNVDASARAALAHVPKLPDGVFWLAEPTVDGGDYCPPGHIDLIASDNSIICDLKTTSRKVTRMKHAALIQLGAYCMATGARKARAIYVDSMGGNWCTPIDVDFNDGQGAALVLEQLPKLVAYWRGPTLMDTAYPMMLSDACGDNFCPYTKVCRDDITPKAGAAFNRRVELASGGIEL
jgi:hypothetical protein